jgi:translation initiation factor 1 (eIF-1/SUI1)
VTVVRGLMLDAMALTTTGKQLRAACGAAGTITMCMVRISANVTGRFG